MSEAESVAEEEDEPVPASTPSDTNATNEPEALDEIAEEGIAMDGVNEESGGGEPRTRSPSPVYSDISDDEPDPGNQEDKKAPTPFQPLFSPLSGLTGSGCPVLIQDNSRSQDSIGSDTPNSGKPDQFQLRYPYSYSITGPQVFTQPPKDFGVSTISPVLISSDKQGENSINSENNDKGRSKVSTPDLKGKKDEGIGPSMKSTGPPPSTSYFPNSYHFIHQSGNPYDAFRNPMVGSFPLGLAPHLAHQSPTHPGPGGSMVPASVVSPGTVSVIKQGPDSGGKKGVDNVSSPGSNSSGSKNGTYCGQWRVRVTRVSAAAKTPPHSPPHSRRCRVSAFLCHTILTEVNKGLLLFLLSDDDANCCLPF